MACPLGAYRTSMELSRTRPRCESLRSFQNVRGAVGLRKSNCLATLPSGMPRTSVTCLKPSVTRKKKRGDETYVTAVSRSYTSVSKKERNGRSVSLPFHTIWQYLLMLG